MRLLAVAAARAFTGSLLLEGGELLEGAPDGEEPWLGDLLGAARLDEALEPSHLPLRG